MILMSCIKVFLFCLMISIIDNLLHGLTKVRCEFYTISRILAIPARSLQESYCQFENSKNDPKQSQG